MYITVLHIIIYMCTVTFNREVANVNNMNNHERRVHVVNLKLLHLYVLQTHTHTHIYSMHIQKTFIYLYMRIQKYFIIID